ncbi:MAG: hypothetical protein CMG32_01965 [Candidatus Marinimicrobia bacterium]|jgi:hypothetical protein|nr:hypothetical protein [Candidatus Neomarinimicrobiota bacterium]|tara:strand:+ start:495 stop:1604 length:1110 start_codon:yes stop_codon:yes gene_type:complete
MLILWYLKDIQTIFIPFGTFIVSNQLKNKTYLRIIMQLPKHIICYAIIMLSFFFEGCYTQLSVQKRVVVAEQPFRSNQTDSDDQEYVLDSDTIVVEDGESVTIINNYSSLSLNPYYDDHWGFDPFYNANFYYRPYGGVHYSYLHRPFRTNYGYTYWYDPYFYDPGYFCYSGYYGSYYGHWYGYPYSNWHGSSSYYSHYEKKKRNWDRRRGDLERQPVVRPTSQSSGKLDNVVVTSRRNNIAHVVRQPAPSKNTVVQSDRTMNRDNRQSKNNSRNRTIIVRRGDRKEKKYQKKEAKKDVVKRVGSSAKKKKYRKKKSRSYANEIIRSVLGEVVSAASHSSDSRSQPNRKKTSKKARSTTRSSEKSNRRSR